MKTHLLKGEAVNIENLKDLVKHADQTTAAVNANVKELLDSDSPDSVKKNVLIEYLATLQVELEFMAREIDEETKPKKKFRLFKK